VLDTKVVVGMVTVVDTAMVEDMEMVVGMQKVDMMVVDMMVVDMTVVGKRVVDIVAGGMRDMDMMVEDSNR
jgi:hypothetical protein